MLISRGNKKKLKIYLLSNSFNTPNNLNLNFCFTTKIVFCMALQRIKDCISFTLKLITIMKHVNNKKWFITTKQWTSVHEWNNKRHRWNANQSNKFWTWILRQSVQCTGWYTSRLHLSQSYSSMLWQWFRFAAYQIASRSSCATNYFLPMAKWNVRSQISYEIRETKSISYGIWRD